jgi:hypothetical protein
LIIFDQIEKSSIEDQRSLGHSNDATHSVLEELERLRDARGAGAKLAWRNCETLIELTGQL